MSATRRCTRCNTLLPADSPGDICPRCLLQVGLGEAGISGPTAGPTTPHDPTFVPPTPAELAPRFPQLEILEFLGRGGMGAVYKARQPALDRIVALKILPPGATSNPAFAERFTREARALARLNHPHIVAIHDLGQSDGLYYFIMEYVDGASLREILRGGELSPSQALAIIPQICDALQYAHDEGIVHRDIKPENILLDRRGRAKIADFGLAKLLGQTAVDARLTASYQVMGTPMYMAPEQIERPQGVDHRADIYSLGVVFYEMLTGELPLGRFAPPSEKVHVDVRLDEVVLKTLQKSPERRYQHASEVKTDVEAIAREEAGRPEPSPRPASADGPSADRAALVETAKRRVGACSHGLIAAGCIAALTGISAGIGTLPFYEQAYGAFIAGEALWLAVLLSVWAAIELARAGLLILGALQLKHVESYRLAWTAVIMALLPAGPEWFLGLPIGLWALSLLLDEQIKAAFGRPVSKVPGARAKPSETQSANAARPSAMSFLRRKRLRLPLEIIAAIGLASLLGYWLWQSWLAPPAGPARYLKFSFDPAYASPSHLADIVSRRVNTSWRPTVEATVTNPGELWLKVYAGGDPQRVDRVRRLLSRVGQVEIRVLATSGDEEQLLLAAAASEGSLVSINGQARAKWVSVAPLADAKVQSVPYVARHQENGASSAWQALVLLDPYHLGSASQVRADVITNARGRPALRIRLNNQGELNRLEAVIYRSDAIGRPVVVRELAVIIDDVIYSPPAELEEDLDLLLTDLTVQEMHDLADVINSGPLPRKLTLLEP